MILDAWVHDIRAHMIGWEYGCISCILVSGTSGGRPGEGDNVCAILRLGLNDKVSSIS